MKFSIKLSGQTLYTAMRKCGYASTGKPHTRANTVQGESAFQRTLHGPRYPKFHIYATLSQYRKTAFLNLHLDQKQPSYKGSHAHSAEYEGPLVEAEAARIQTCLNV